MSHPVLEITAGAFVVAAMALGAMFVLPRPKPEPPPPQVETAQEALKRCEANPDRMCVVRAEPLPQATDVQRIEKIEKELESINREQKTLIEQVKQATAKEKER